MSGTALARWDVLDAFYALTSRHCPLRVGRDTVHVSPEAVCLVPDDARLVVMVDLRLHGVEMRVERRT